MEGKMEGEKERDGCGCMTRKDKGRGGRERGGEGRGGEGQGFVFFCYSYYRSTPCPFIHLFIIMATCNLYISVWLPITQEVGYTVQEVILPSCQ